MPGKILGETSTWGFFLPRMNSRTHELVSREWYNMVMGFMQRRRIQGEARQKNLRAQGFKHVFSIHFREQTH